MGRKLKRLIEEEERTEAKLEELQNHLKEVRIARKQEEDLEIVRSIRTMKLGARELMEMLSGIQNGTVSIENLPPVPEEGEPEAESPGEKEGPVEHAEAGSDEETGMTGDTGDDLESLQDKGREY